MVTRREKEIEAMRELIIATAKEIIAKEGLDNLSIRKIARKIEYSPSVIYNYFKDKEELVNTIMRSGYMKIINAVSASDLENLSPREKLAEMRKFGNVDKLTDLISVFQEKDMDWFWIDMFVTAEVEISDKTHINELALTFVKFYNEMFGFLDR
jgi:AcrR family transcriptional regulator